MRRPLVALVVAFGFGIWLAYKTPIPSFVGWIIGACCLITACVFALRAKGGALRFLVWLGAVLGIGFARGDLPSRSTLFPPRGLVVATGKACKGWSHTSNRLRMEMDLLAVQEPGKSIKPFAGKMLVSVQNHKKCSCPRVLPGDTMRVMTHVRPLSSSRNPGVYESALRLKRRGIDWIGSVKSCSDIVIEVRDTSFSLLRIAERIRYSIQTFIEDCKGSKEALGILTALTIGDAGKVPRLLREDFSKAGLAHLLAVSGLHLGLVALGLYWLLTRIMVCIPRLPLCLDVRRFAALLVMPVIIFYCLLVGARLPAVRACVMVIAFLLSVIIQRRSDPMQTLSGAGLIILGLWPQSLFEVSFQLSFAGVAGVLFLVPRLTEYLPLPYESSRYFCRLCMKAFFGLGKLLVVCLAAILSTVPLVAWHFNQVSFVGVVANLVAIPLAVWLIVPLGLFMSVLIPLSLTLARILAHVDLYLAHKLASITTFFGAFPQGSFHTVTPSILLIGLWYFVLLALSQIGRKQWATWGLGVGTALLIVVWSITRVAPFATNDLQVTFLDVGQGDAIFVRLPDKTNILVDGGGSYTSDFDIGRQVVAPFLWGQGISRLDYVVATHRHPDHVGGLPSIVRLFRPKEIWTNARLEQEDASVPLARAALEVGAKVRILSAGAQPVFHPSVHIQVLWPANNMEDYEENERSLVLKLTYEKYSFLLTGDLELNGEVELLEKQGQNLRVNVLKVGHHGSKHATSSAFLNAVQPQVAVISVGKNNRYHLPHPEVINRLYKAGIEIFRTDQNGGITITTDGQQLDISSVVRPHI